MRRHACERPRPYFVLGLGFILLAIGAGAGAAESDAPPPPSAASPPPLEGRRPRLALVLSGGGARGAAHIGVIKVLEELHIPVDLVTGTSMGAVVGGLYASGWTAQEMEDYLSAVEWNRVFVDRLARLDRSFRRKQDDAIFLVPVKLRFRNWKPYIPSGLLGGQRLELLLRSLEIKSTGETDFDRFPIPYRAVATDIVTGEAVILRSGSLATAIRASMSVPGAFPPVEVNGRKLVDGGAVANLPVGIAQSEGAEAVIAVDITSPLSEEEGIGSLFTILSQQSGFLTVGNRREDIARLREGDVLVQPDLGDISFVDFKRVSEAVAMGERAARAVEDKLRRFSVSDAEWEAFKSRHHRRSADELYVDTMTVDNTSPVDDRVIAHYLPDRSNAPLDLDALERDIVSLYGLDYFGTIRPEFRLEEEKRVLALAVPPKPYSRNSLQFGLSLRDDFQGESDYSFTIRHLFIAVNRMGGEWENVAQVGTPELIRTAFYQPLDYGMRWFAEPSFELSQRVQSLWVDEEAVAEFTLKAADARLDFGRVLGNWGELRAGAFRYDSSGEPRIGPPIFEPYDEIDVGWRAQFRIDTRDSVVFPRRGAHLVAEYEHALESLGADLPYRVGHIRAQHAWSFGRNTIMPGVFVGDNFEDEVALRTLFGLGGAFELSGLADKELLGSRAGLARAVYYYQLTKLDLGVLTTSLFAGASVETGNTFSEGDAISLDNLRHAGSVFVGAETVLGPVVVAFGMSDGGRRRVYLIIGQSF